MLATDSHDATGAPAPDLVCLSHLRWDFVFQRPQHLLTRFATTRRVFFVEEPLEAVDGPRLETRRAEHGVHIITPRLTTPRGPHAEPQVRALLRDLFRREAVHAPVLWFYTPMAIPLARGLPASAVVYDCMDELSAFAGAPAEMRTREAELLALADVVFTGGESLYAAKRNRHPRVHAFPSSVDVPHFRKARSLAEADDQRQLPQPRLGYYGVIDERMDLDLLRGLAEARPAWQIVLIGPTAKIDPASLPRNPNIHYLGARSYQQLPAYLAGWQVAMLPFARNDSTRYISPTKTPEYLAAGRPVVSTSIADVVRPYGERGLVRIADSVTDFVAAVEAALAHDGPAVEADQFLAGMSWDTTVTRMDRLVHQVIARKHAPSAPGVATVCQPSTI
jgi:glycosyltransferase involved in cell wall biosynthesis